MAVCIALVNTVRGMGYIMDSFFSVIRVDLSRFDWQGVSAVSGLLMVWLNIVSIVGVVIGYREL